MLQSMSSYFKTGHLPKEDKEISYRKSDFDTLEPDPPFWTKTSLLQLGYGIWVNLTLLNIGLCLEFSAIAIPQLKKQAKIPMTKNEEASIASVLPLSSPIGCMIAGILLDRCGRKAGLLWCQVPIAVGWLYIGFARYASDIILGRVITGIGIGMAMIAPRAYVTEITLPNMRGVVGGLSNLAISMGLTIQAILGSFLQWRILCYLCGTYATILLCVNQFLPDTPYYILLHSTTSTAKIALKRFRSSKYNLEAELQTLEDFKAVNNIRRLTLCETRKALFKLTTCKPFGIILFYITLMQFSGVNVVTTWGVEMLELARSSISPHLGNVVLAITRIVFGVATTFLLFRVKRRSLALTSAIGVGGVGISLGGYLLTNEGGGRSPLVMMVAFVAFAVPGYYTLPMLMVFELFPLQLRGILSGVVLSSGNLLMSLVIHIFPTMRDTIGLANTFITYGTISLFGAIVLYFILPETKDLTLQEIEEYFNHRRATLISERKLVSAQLRSHHSQQTNSFLRNNQSHIDVTKNKKRLRIVSSQDQATRHSSTNFEKENPVLSKDDIDIVYDKDEKGNADHVKKDNVDIDKKDDVDRSQKENVDDEEKDKKDKTDPDDINKPSTSGI